MDTLAIMATVPGREGAAVLACTAAVGAIVWWVAATVWPSTVQEIASTLVVAAEATCALGFLQRGGGESGPAVSSGLPPARPPAWASPHLRCSPACRCGLRITWPCSRCAS